MTTQREEWAHIVDGFGHDSIVDQDYHLIAYVCGESGLVDRNARRIAAVPDLEQALLGTAGYFRDVGQALPC